MRTLTTAQTHTTGSGWVEVNTPTGTVWVPSGTTWDEWNDSNYSLNQYSISLNTQLAPKWNLITEAVTNNTGSVDNANKHGLWTRLTYGKQDWSKGGTWQVYGEYFALGNTAVDSSGWGHRLNIAGGDGYGNHGARGFGLGVDYMLADNTNLAVSWYKLKPYDEAAAGFSKYNDVVLSALTYSF